MYNRQSVFQGRNGSDQLSVFLVALAIVLVIIYPFFPQRYVQLILCLLALALISFSVFRMLSKNVVKRRNENMKFLSIFGRKSKKSDINDASFREASAFNDKKAKNEEKKVLKQKEKEEKKAKKENKKIYAYFKCPDCHTELRAPKGKGKIRVTCPVCKKQFEEKT